jgi:hypothetical protein
MAKEPSQTDPLAAYHASKSVIGGPEEGGTPSGPYPDLTFFPSKTRSRTIPAHSILAIDADTEGGEHRIIFTHHLGVIQIVGQGLEVLADLIRKRQIAEIHMGAQQGGGNIKRIILDMGK